MELPGQPVETLTLDTGGRLDRQFHVLHRPSSVVRMVISDILSSEALERVDYEGIKPSEPRL
ncbi:hypothetical protein GCM10023194_35120 [Planotetraspora phitsanulokensis]